ncbi:O-antigen ligase family protein [Desulfospira joergensenii]|uniref:O-antigen ligase family protein n=1 Tax=Desulfospira joergensenii TaxID=53329 RepID=UPI0003FDB163|nr:O-antigen ligase [Desulfospira joergensenii]
MIRTIPRLPRFLLFFLVIFTPLAFGSREPWSYAVMEILTAIGLLFFFLPVLWKQEDLYRVPGFIPLLIFLFFILFQLVPLPPSLLKMLSPHAFSIHSQAAGLMEAQTWMSLSVHPKATLFQFFRYATYAAFYVLTVQVLKEKENLQAMTFSMAVFGGLLAFSSILQFYLTQDMALWFRYTPDNSIVMGPYINHNHYAGLMEMIFPVVLALFFFYRPRIGKTSFFRGIVEILSQEKANIHILIGTSALLIVVSIFVSLSRGGMISTFLALGVFACLMIKRKISRKNSLLLILVIMIAALSVGWFGWDQILERFAVLKKSSGVIHEGRLDFWKDSSRIIRDFKLTGSGMGSFIHIYPPYKTLVDRMSLSHAHNDYIELLVEGGILGFGLAAAFLITLFTTTYRAFLKRRDAFSIYLYMGSLTGMVSILFHSFTDFNLQVGANGLWFFFMAGLAVSAAHTNIRQRNALTRLPVVGPGFGKNLFIFTGSLFALAVIVFQICHLLGLVYLYPIRGMDMDKKPNPRVLEKIENLARSASRYDPLRAEPRFILANTAWLKKDIPAARENFRAAVRLDPLNSWYLKRLGLFYNEQGLAQKAGTAFRLSAEYTPTLPEFSFQYGTWLLKNGQAGRGIQAMRTTLELDKKYVDKVLSAMILSGIDLDRMREAIPDRPGPMISFAQFLYTIGKKQEAARIHLDILDLLGKGDEGPWAYYKILQFFMRQNNMKNAMAVMEKAETAMPENPGIKITLGDLYQRQGILYKAREKYEQALYVDPGNKKARQRIRKLEKTN